MKGKKADRQIARVRPLFAQWIAALGLGWWEVEINYYHKRKEFKKDAHHTAVMRVWADWRYAAATIAVCLPALAAVDDDDLERIVVHELMHVFVNEMRAGGVDHEERVVTTLTKAMFWVRAAAKDGRL